MPPLAAYIALLVTHWVADFGLQTHWQASNKNKNNVALSRHVFIYTGCLAAVSYPLPAWPGHAPQWLLFVAGNGILHFATDYVTSRISSKLFMGQFETLELYPLNRVAMKQPFNPHNFFVMIGFDQLIHQVTLAATMWLAFYR